MAGDKALQAQRFETRQALDGLGGGVGVGRVGIDRAALAPHGQGRDLPDLVGFGQKIGVDFPRLGQKIAQRSVFGVDGNACVGAGFF